MRRDVLFLLLDFDPKAFFSTVLLLFKGRPWRFITSDTKGRVWRFQKDGTLENVKNRTQVAENRGAVRPNNNIDIELIRERESNCIADLESQMCENKTVNDILFVLKQAAVSQDRHDRELALSRFLELLLSIVVHHSKSGPPAAKQLIENFWIVAAIKRMILGKEETQEVLEKVFGNAASQDFEVDQ